MKNYLKKIFIISSILFLSLAHSTEENSQEKINEILRELGLSHISEINPDGNSILHILIKKNYSFDIIKLFVESGAKTNATDRGGNTPLHKAKTPEIANILIKNNADVNARNRAENTPLHKAKTVEIAQTLIENGADPTAKNGYGETPVDLARERGHHDVVSFLEANSKDTLENKNSSQKDSESKNSKPCATSMSD